MIVLSISGLGSPHGIAVDGNGNLYVADVTNGDVVEVPAGGGNPSFVASRLDKSPRGWRWMLSGKRVRRRKQFRDRIPVRRRTTSPFQAADITIRVDWQWTQRAMFLVADTRKRQNRGGVPLVALRNRSSR